VTIVTYQPLCETSDFERRLQFDEGYNAAMSHGAAA
jgi:hypothetical protein